MKVTHENMIKKGLERKTTKKVVVLVSGGADSAATAAKLCDEGYEVSGLFVDYGQLNRDAELHCVKSWVMTHDELMKTVMTSGDLNVTKSKSLVDLFILRLPPDLCILLGMKKNKPKNDDEAYIPFRNTLFMVLAAIYANRVNADGISIGLMKEDFGVFPDSNLSHHSLVETLLTYSAARAYEVFLPIKDCSKSEIMEICSKRNLMTVSCWSAKLVDSVYGVIVKVCGECAQCKERMGAERS